MNVWLPASTAFLASAVEAVEALTVVLAIGTTRGWRLALSGAGAALVSLALLIAIFGPALVRFVPLEALRLVVGLLLVLYGLAWLRKAIWRYGGRKALRDEAANFAREREESAGVADGVARATSFKAVFLEGLEVVIIVVTVGAQSTGGVGFAALGALAAVLLVVAVGIAVRAPLSRVPENALKFVVGIMLASFGTFWSGEGLGITWWQADASIPVIAASFLAIALGLIALLRATAARAVPVLR